MDAGRYEGTDPYIFISYSHEDRDRIDPVLRALYACGYRFWYDEGIPAGSAWTGAVSERIARCTVFLPFLSPAFMASENCLQEVRYMHTKKREIVPIWVEKMDRDQIPFEMEFLMNKAEELRLDAFADAEAFAASLDDEPIFQTCRGAAGTGRGPAGRRAEIVTLASATIPRGFVGRETEMRRIRDAFRDADVVVLYGIGGIGKSEIARKLFFDWTRGDGTDLARRVGWVTWKGKIEDTFYGQFSDIDETDAGRYWRAARRLMADAGRDLLIVLDDADSMTDAAAERLTTLGCRFLVTTRYRPGTGRVARIGTPTLPPGPCRVLYRRNCADDADDMDGTALTIADETPDGTLDEILRLAAWHTLTVRLLAKTQRAAGLSAAGLLDRLKASGFDLSDVTAEIYHLRRPEQDGEEDDGWRTFVDHIARIFDLSPLRDDPRGPDALRALRGMSLLAPNVSVPAQDAQTWLGLDDRNGLDRAARLGWLEEGRDADGGRQIAIHPVIASVVRRLAPPDAEQIDAVAGELRRAMIPGPTEVFTTKLYMIEHAVELDRVARALSLSMETKNYAGMLHQIGYLTMEQGDYESALVWYRKALDIQERILGRDHPDTATSYNNIGHVYNSMGDYESALDWYRKALDIDEKVLGKDHPSTAIDYNNIGLVYQSMGDYESALDWLRKALDIIEKVLGFEHPYTASSYNNIGGVYKSMGDYESALDWYRKALDIDEKALGKSHPGTATDYHNIGTLYFQKGDYREALEWFHKAQTINLNVLGPEHPHTTITQGYIDQAQLFLGLEKMMGASPSEEGADLSEEDLTKLLSMLEELMDEPSSGEGDEDRGG